MKRFQKKLLSVYKSVLELDGIYSASTLRLQPAFQTNQNEVYLTQNIKVQNMNTSVRMYCMDEDSIELGARSSRGLGSRRIASSKVDKGNDSKEFQNIVALMEDMMKKIEINSQQEDVVFDAVGETVDWMLEWIEEQEEMGPFGSLGLKVPKSWFPQEFLDVVTNYRVRGALLHSSSEIPQER